MKQLVLIIATLSASSFLVNRAIGESTTYSVYCASGKIEVDTRTLPQMKSARGSDVCKLSEFNFLSDAHSFATKNFGGIGKSCRCS